MKMTNATMEQCIEVMSGLTETGKLGYAIARNTRKLKEAAEDYLKIKGELLQKYGTQKKGSQTITITGEENIEKFLTELGDIPTIEHDVDIYQIPEDVFFSGNLNSAQMESLLWMVEGWKEAK